MSDGEAGRMTDPLPAVVHSKGALAEIVHAFLELPVRYRGRG